MIDRCSFRIRKKKRCSHKSVLQGAWLVRWLRFPQGPQAVALHLCCRRNPREHMTFTPPPPWGTSPSGHLTLGAPRRVSIKCPPLFFFPVYTRKQTTLTAAVTIRFPTSLLFSVLNFLAMSHNGPKE